MKTDNQTNAENQATEKYVRSFRPGKDGFLTIFDRAAPYLSDDDLSVLARAGHIASGENLNMMLIMEELGDIAGGEGFGDSNNFMCALMYHLEFFNGVLHDILMISDAANDLLKEKKRKKAAA